MAIMRDEPDVGLAGLSIWVLGRQIPDQDDFWDGNWLNVLVRVEATGATVEVRGPIIHAGELASFTEELELLDATLTGNASLKCMEPNLDVVIRGDKRGQAKMTIRITPDYLAQSHEFICSIDQTYFKPVIVQCRRILSVFQIRGARDQQRL